MIETKRLRIVPFEMDQLEAYFTGFDNEVTKYQYPDPFGSIEEAKEFLMSRLDMEACLIYDEDGEFKTWCTPGFHLE